MVPTVGWIRVASGAALSPQPAHLGGHFVITLSERESGTLSGERLNGRCEKASDDEDVPVGSPTRRERE